MPFHLQFYQVRKEKSVPDLFILSKLPIQFVSQAQEKNATENNVTSILIQRGVCLPKEVLYFEKEFKCQPTQARHDKYNMELS